jgi:hypothetical protein
MECGKEVTSAAFPFSQRKYFISLFPSFMTTVAIFPSSFKNEVVN